LAVVPMPVPLLAEGVVVVEVAGVVTVAGAVVFALVTPGAAVFAAVLAAWVVEAAVIEAAVVGAEVVEAGAGVADAEESPQAASSTSKKENSTMAVRGRKRRLKITLFIKLTSISLSPFNQASLLNKLAYQTNNFHARNVLFLFLITPEKVLKKFLWN